MNHGSGKRRYAEQMQHLVEEYRESGGKWPATAREMARWMIRTKKWDRGDKEMVDICARDIARSLREEFHADPQGRRVRTKHAALMPARDGHEQLTLWHDIREAPRDFMERAFKGRRNQIVGDCVQLSTDVDSYNDNVCKNNPIPMLWDFTDDVTEAKQTGGSTAAVEDFDPTAFEPPSGQPLPEVVPLAPSLAPSRPCSHQA